MATYYLDMIGGNDANNGTTFALRKKTLASFGSSLTANDMLRIMKSPDPTNIGNATWSASSNAITLAGAVTAEISKSNAANWTAATNVSITGSTSTIDWRIGTTNGAVINVASGFTTGKAAYAACTTANLSGYQQISFFLGLGASIGANAMYIDLCSDATGDVPIISLPVPALPSMTSVSAPITIDYDSALPSNVASIAIRFASDPGTVAIRIHNIIACKASSADDSLTLSSIIGLNTANEPEWFQIYSIDGATVKLDIANNWAGTAGLYPTYKMEPIRLTRVGITPATQAGTGNATQMSFGSGGTSAGGFLNIEGGWDTTDMSTQTGLTAIDNVSFSGRGFASTTGYLYQHNIINVRTYSIFSQQTTTTNKFGIFHSVGSYLPLYAAGAAGQIFFDKMYVTSFNSQTNSAFCESFIGNVLSLKYYNIVGGQASSSPLHYIPLTSQTSINKLYVYGARNLRYSYGNHYAGDIDFRPSNATSVNILSIDSQTLLKIKTLTYTGAAATGLISSVSIAPSNVSIENFIANNLPASLITSGGSGNINVFIQNYNNTGAAKGFSDYYTLNPVTTPVRTAGGKAWEFKVTLATVLRLVGYSEYYKSRSYNIADIPVKANKQVTASIWVRRKFTSSKCAFFVRPEVSGITDYIVAESAGAADTWEQLTLTFTPAIDSVIPLWFSAQYDSGQATQAFYFDDLSITIAD